jgi:hypothetical protein
MAGISGNTVLNNKKTHTNYGFPTMLYDASRAGIQIIIVSGAQCSML